MKKKQDIYKVDWIGKGASSFYSRTFASKEEAIAFSKSVDEALVFRLSKTSEKAFQWQLVPTISGQELLKAITMRRELEKKGRLVNRGGISSMGVVTTTEMQKSQRTRLIGMAVVPAVTFYTAYKFKEMPIWLRASLVVVGACSLYVNGRNYMTNSKLSKSKK